MKARGADRFWLNVVPRTEIDHVQPKSRGGSDRLDNRVLACHPCNRTKGARTVDEFEAMRAPR